eukprot:2407146-Prymnesium_polylepis.1
MQRERRSESAAGSAPAEADAPSMQAAATSRRSTRSSATTGAMRSGVEPNLSILFASSHVTCAVNVPFPGMPHHRDAAFVVGASTSKSCEHR